MEIAHHLISVHAERYYQKIFYGNWYIKTVENTNNN